MSAAEFPWTAIPEPPGGELQRGMLSWQDLPEPDGLAYIAIRGAASGPAVLVRVAPGPPSYPAVHALFRLAGSLDPSRLSGTLLVIPQLLSPAELSPFPGSTGGNQAERRTHHLVRDILAPADALIELSGYSPGEHGLAHVCYHRSAGVGAAPGDAGRLARAAQLGYAIGMDLSSDRRDGAGWFARRERPAVRLMLPDIPPSEREPMLDAAMSSLTNMLRRLGALRGIQMESGARLSTLAGVALAPADGLWDPAVQPGELVGTEMPLGSILTFTGELLGRLIAVRAGVVLSVSSAVRVRSGDVLVRLIEAEGE